jgi:hypothetical protein
MARVLLDRVIDTDYGQFDLLWDDDHGFDGDFDRSFADQVNGLVGAASGHGLYVSLARRSGGSPVRIVLLDDAPPLRDDEWEDIVEVSTTLPRVPDGLTPSHGTPWPAGLRRVTSRHRDQRQAAGPSPARRGVTRAVRSSRHAAPPGDPIVDRARHRPAATPRRTNPRPLAASRLPGRAEAGRGRCQAVRVLRAAEIPSVDQARTPPAIRANRFVREPAVAAGRRTSGRLVRRWRGPGGRC